MKLKDYMVKINFLSDKDVAVEYYFTNSPDKKRLYINARDYQIEKIVKCIEDNVFKLKIYVNTPNEIYDDIIKDIEETTKKWLPKYCETHNNCLSCPYHSIDKIRYGDSKTTHCKLEYIAYNVNLTTDFTIRSVK